MFLTLNMKHLWHLALLLAFLAGFSACSPNPHADKAKTLDSLYSELIVAEQKLASHPPEKAEAIFEEISTVSELAQSFIVGSEADSLISLYEKLKSPLNNYLANYSKFEDELKLAKVQVETLENDLKKGFVNGQTLEYYELELKSGIDIIARSKALALGFEDVLTNFNILQPKILNQIEESSKLEAHKNK